MTTREELGEGSERSCLEKNKEPEDFVKHHKDGSIWAKGQMLDGKQTGYWEWFRKDGTLMRSGTFSEGEQVGEWTTCRRDGEVVKVTDFGMNDD